MNNTFDWNRFCKVVNTCAGQYGTYGETGAIIGLAVTLTGRVDTQSGGTVGQDSLGNSQTGNRLC